MPTTTTERHNSSMIPMKNTYKNRITKMTALGWWRMKQSCYSTTQCCCNNNNIPTGIYPGRSFSSYRILRSLWRKVYAHCLRRNFTSIFLPVFLLLSTEWYVRFQVPYPTYVLILGRMIGISLMTSFYNHIFSRSLLLNHFSTFDLLVKDRIYYQNNKRDEANKEVDCSNNPIHYGDPSNL